MRVNAKYSVSPSRILLAEDNELNQKVTSLMLERLGYKVDVAGNGIEVLEALRRRSYALVLMNIGMPKMDGIETTREIRRLWHNSLKIIAITAYVLPGIRATCLEAGMDDYIGKPVRIEELAKVLGKYRLSQVSS